MVSILTSVIAISFSGYQLHIYNKQFLFDKRLLIFRTYKNFLKHQNEAERYFKNKPSNTLFDHSFLIKDLTNDSEFYQMCNGWDDPSPLLEPCDKKNLLSMVEKIRTYGEESVFVFSKYGNTLCDYFNKYADLLHKTYQYRINMRHIESENKQNSAKGNPMSLKEAQERQEQLHKDLIITYNDLCETSKLIDLDKLIKSISFTKGK